MRAYKISSETVKRIFLIIDTCFMNGYYAIELQNFMGNAVSRKF